MVLERNWEINWSINWEDKADIKMEIGKRSTLVGANNSGIYGDGAKLDMGRPY